MCRDSAHAIAYVIFSKCQEGIMFILYYIFVCNLLIQDPLVLPDLLNNCFINSLYINYYVFVCFNFVGKYQYDYLMY